MHVNYTGSIVNTVQSVYINQLPMTGHKKQQFPLRVLGLGLTIKSGDEVYWKSVDCQTGADSREVILSPDNPLSTQKITWDRTRSSPETCAAVREPVPAGGAAYNVTATANGVESAEPWQFLLN